jgi:hypothetical protein
MTFFGARASLGAVIFAVVSLAGAPLAAQPKERAAALQQLTDCRQQTDNARRLACYDTAVAGMEQAEAKGDIVVVDREQAGAVRRQAFGFNLPSLSMFAGGDKPEAVDNVSLKVESATRMANGKWLLRLEGGQVWRQIDTAELMRTPKAGSLVTIRSASLGSFRLSTEGGGTIRVHRDN